MDEKLYEESEAFWHEFKMLAAKYLRKFEEPYRTDFAYRIGDKTSVFHPGVWDEVRK